ncbi:NitT/TauT family transport system substrate-binding protein [Nitrobacteraceae bacterium AZCC 2161]
MSVAKISSGLKVTRRDALIGAASLIVSPALAQTKLASIEIPSLAMPSLGYFPVPVIKAKGFDRANGLDISFVSKAAAIYRSDFASGANPVGGSGSLLIDVGLVNDKGSKVVYLFNTNDYWGTVAVRKDSGINSLPDLAGKTLAAALPTSNYTIFRVLAKLAGLDLSKVEVTNTSQTALVPTMIAGRTDAVQLWEPAYSVLAATGNYKALDFVQMWREKLNEEYMPYQGIAAHKSWIDANPQLIPRLYATYEQTLDFITSHPGEAAKIISDTSKIHVDVLEGLIRANRPAFRLYWGGEQRGAGQAMFKAAIDIGFMKDMPPDDIFFDKPV